MNERRIAELEELMSLPENYSDHEKLAIYNAEYEEVKGRLETLYKKWEEAEERLQTLRASQAGDPK